MSLVRFCLFVICTPLRKFRHFLDKRNVASRETLKERFTLIYDKNMWGSRESISGSGSTLLMTSAIRTELPLLISKFRIQSIFDAPCGDFNWMKSVDLTDVTYVGADIVEGLINDLNCSYKSSNLKFVCLDITKDPFPKSDLMLNRDCLFHLSYQDILSLLENYVNSDIQYFLSTSHVNNGEFFNHDIESGDFRLIDLFQEPFCFPNESLFEITEPGEGGNPARKLCLWDRAQVVVALRNLDNFLTSDRKN
jgi:hypothetical protein